MTEAPHNRPAVHDLPVRMISYAWGESYVDDLLNFTIPALLAPGNLPAIAQEVRSELVLVSEERLFERITNHPVIKEVRNFCPVRLVGLDDLVTRSDKYGMALTFALHRAFADLGPAMTEHWLIFFNADFILADGSLWSLLNHLRNGERIVASPSYCTVKERVIPELKLRLATNPKLLTIPAREMARLILRYRHNTIRGKTINQDELHLLQADQFYWHVDDNTLIGHQMPIAIVGMRPQRYLPEPNSYWDHGLMLELCPTAEVKVLGDSDEFLMLELRGGTVAKDQIVAGRPDPRELAERMITWVTPYQASFALKPITLHAADLPPSIEAARTQLDDFVTTMLSYTPNFPSHIDHPQWNYHWSDFIKSRHAFLSAKLGSMTEKQQPPATMLPIDRLWWRYYGAERSLARKKRLIHEEKALKLRPLQDALEAVEAEFGELSDKASFSTILLPEGKIATAPAFDSPDRLRAIELLTARKRDLAMSLTAIEQTYGELLGSLERENEQLRREYGKRVRSRVKSAGIPVVQWRVGNEPPPALFEGRIRHMARSIYYRMFGRWPRVTMLNPYWPSTQPLLQAIETAKGEGASDLLLVSEPSGLARGLRGLAGKMAYVSYDGFISGLLSKALEPQRQFDLAIIELKLEDIAQFSDLVEMARPYLRAKAMIIGFGLLAGQQAVQVTANALPGHVVVTGSADSARAIAAYAAIFADGRGSRPVRLLRKLSALAINVPRFWWINRTEALAMRRQVKAEIAFSTSVTIAVRIPQEFDEQPAIEVDFRGSDPAEAPEMTAA